jgi:hypothetical protein
MTTIHLNTEAERNSEMPYVLKYTSDDSLQHNFVRIYKMCFEHESGLFAPLCHGP